MSIPFFRVLVCLCMHADMRVCELLSHLRFCVTLWTVTCWAPLSMEFSRPFPSSGDLPNPGMEPGSPTLQADSLSPPGCSYPGTNLLCPTPNLPPKSLPSDCGQNWMMCWLRSGTGSAEMDELVTFFSKVYLFNFLAVVGLCCCVLPFSSCREWGQLLVEMRGLLFVVASLVAEHRL